MAKKILFINGPSQDPSDRFFGYPTSLLYAMAPTISKIKSGELEVDCVTKIFDPIWYVEGKNDEQAKSEFRNLIKDVGVVCASATYDSLYPTLKLFEEAKKTKSNITTILGGPHFDEVHNLSKFNDVKLKPNLIDYAIAGDGEFALEHLLQKISKDKNNFDFLNVSGKAWIYDSKGNIYLTNGQTLDLGGLPFIPLDFVDVERHKNDFDIFKDGYGNILPTVQMISQRGCAYNCNFCSERRDLAYPNVRSIDNIVEEIELRKNQGFKAAFFDDSTFGSHPNLEELLRELGKTKMVFGSLNRFNNLVTPKIVEAYRKAGFAYVYCSIEQFDDSALKFMEKNQDIKTISKSMDLLSKNDFVVGTSLLYGLSYESPKSIENTLNFTEKYVKNGTIKLVSESILSYHPGTPAGKNINRRFNRTPPNKGFPFDRFEEGQWYHSPHVNPKYLEKILKMSEERFGDVMVRNRHSWYAQKGYLVTEN